MDELISKQKVIDKLDEALERITRNVSKESDAYHIVYGTVDIIKCMIMTIQPEIVRCKDCKYARLTDDGSCKYCDIWFPDEAEYMDGDYYCASAERKSNG